MFGEMRTSIWEVKSVYSDYKKNDDALRPVSDPLLQRAELSRATNVTKRNQIQVNRLEGMLKQCVTSESNEFKRLN